MSSLMSAIIAKGIQQPTAEGILGGVAGVKNIEGRNKLLDLNSQIQERNIQEFDANATGRADERLLKSLQVGSELAMPFVQKNDDVGLLNYLKARKATLQASKIDTTHTDEAIAAMESGDPAQIAETKKLLVHFATMGEEKGANAQFGNSRPVKATTASGRQLNGIMSDIRDPNTGEITTEFIPDVPGSWDAASDPITSTSNVGRTGQTGAEQAEATRVRQLELEEKKTEEGRERKEDNAQVERLTGFADTGLASADAHTTTKRSLQLLNEIETGGFEGVALKAKQLFGIQSADEAELSTGMLRVVLAQLRPIFGAAFTKAEGDSLKAIEANIGKSTEGNKALLSQLLKMQERSVRRGIAAARKIGDDFTAEEIQSAFDFELSDPAAPAAPQLEEGQFIRLGNGQRQQVVNGKLVDVDG